MAKNNLNRNDPCHCGNGKKYKVCHGKQKKSPSPILYVVIIFILGMGYWFVSSENIVSTNQKTPSGNKLLTSDSDSEPAPPGKVWSPEHNHWHDKPDYQLQKKSKNIQSEPKSTKAPPQEKVWSPEHNHWHDQE